MFVVRKNILFGISGVIFEVPIYTKFQIFQEGGLCPAAHWGVLYPRPLSWWRGLAAPFRDRNPTPAGGLKLPPPEGPP